MDSNSILTINTVGFIVVGTQKAGTSSLHHYLKNHPEIGLAKMKEVHFFDREINFKQTPDYNIYLKQFDFNQQKKIYGELTPIYMYWKESCSRIWNYNPDIKLIFILRNPIERAFSHWNMEFDRGNEKHDFHYCIRNEQLRLKNGSLQQRRIVSYCDRGFYAEQIRRFKNRFDEEQLLFIKYEDYVDYQEKILNEIFDFLEVDCAKFSFEPARIHNRFKHSNLNNEDRVYLKDLFASNIQEVEQLLQWDCNDWLAV